MATRYTDGCKIWNVKFGRTNELILQDDQGNVRRPKNIYKGKEMELQVDGMVPVQEEAEKEVADD